MAFKHVLVPLDYSQLAEAALDYALEVVDPQGSLTLLTVVEPSKVAEWDSYPDAASGVAVAVFSGVGIMSPATRSEAIRRAWDNGQHYLDRIVRQLQQPDHFVHTRIEEGHPAERILEVAHELEVDAIVMSTHGRSGFSRWVFGSVAQKVLSTAHCPVLLIPQRVLGEV